MLAVGMDDLEPEMGSKVSPYFILHAERIANPRLPPEPPVVPPNQSQNPHDKTPPMTPAPSSNTEDQREKQPPVSKKPTKQVIVESKRSETLKRKMEIIRERLEKSRERYEERRRLQENSDIRCEPTVIGLTEKGDLPYPLDRSVSDLTPFHGSQKRANGSFPYVYFVVAEDKVVESSTDNMFGPEEVVKHPSKRRAYASERSKQRKEIDERASKLQGIARELGLKSSPMKPIPFSSRPPTRPSISHTAFPSSLPSPPPRMPPGTPATNAFSLDKSDCLPLDVDDQLMRRYPSSINGFRRSKTHSCSLQTFELPFLPMEQQTKSLGITARNHKLTEHYLHRHPLETQRSRKVTFAESLPVIRGSGFVLGEMDSKNRLLPGLGPRAATLGSITLSSENPSKNVKELCQRLRLSDSMDANRVRKLGGIPLSLPRIDIVSSVYDEMVIKMIYNYMNDANTPTRQAQLAKELLHHLQQNNTKEAQTAADELIKAQESEIHRISSSARQSLEHRFEHDAAKHTTRGENPETSKTNEEKENDLQHPLEQDEKTEHDKDKLQVDEDGRQVSSDDEAFAKEPVITVTLRSKEQKEKDLIEEGAEPTEVSPTTLPEKTEGKHNGGVLPIEPINLSLDNDVAGTTKLTTARKSKEKPEFNVVSPTSFKMAPPGLSREDTNLSIKLKS